MIRSSKVTTKFSNKIKLQNLNSVIAEYKSVVSYFVTELWKLDSCPKLLPKDITENCKTWISARLVQCAGKQASGIVRGTLQKQKQRLFIISKLNSEGKLNQARKLQVIYDNTKLSLPNLKSVGMELDSRFVKINLNHSNSFDGWITLTSLGNKLKIVLPFKKTKHFNKLIEFGEIKTGVRISSKSLTFMFDMPNIELKETGETIGLDIGKSTLLSVSNGNISEPNKHNHDLNSILTVLSRKKKGSKGFQRTQTHRTNYINWSINQLNLSGVKELRLENIKYLRKGRNSSRMLSHWTYASIFDKLESKAELEGVLVTRINPTYTSQRCSQCGYTCRSNRKGKNFSCSKCNFTLDADINGARNIALDLEPITVLERLDKKSKAGFYWSCLG